MNRRLLKWLLLPLLAIVLLGLGLHSWLLHSDSGTRWIMARVSSQMGDRLSLGEVSGNLDKGLVLKDLVYQQDGLDVKVARVEAQGEVSLLSLKITFNSLNAFDVVVHTFPAEDASQKQQSSLEDILAGLKLPLELDMRNLKITRLKVIDENNELLFRLDQSALSGRWKDTIELRHLQVNTEDFQLGLKGEIQLQSPFAHKLELGGRVSAMANALAAGNGSAADSGRFEASLEGTASSSIIEVKSHSPAIDLSGQIKRPFDKAEFNLQVKLARYLWNGGQNSKDTHNKDILISDVLGKLSGLPGNYSLQLQATVTADGYPAVDIELDGQGDLASLTIAHMAAKADFLAVDGAGKIGWGERLSYDLEITLQRLQPSIWIPQWPHEQFVSGRLSLLSDDSLIRIRQLQAEVAGTAVQLEGQGVFDLQADILDATLGWTSLGWPLWQQPYQISSQTGKLHINGAPDDWRFAGDLNLQTPEYPGGGFSLSGTGGLGSADIRIEKGEALGGNVTGNASLNWGDALNWQADLDVKNLDTAMLSSDWPAKLDVSLTASQDLARQSFILQFDHLHAELGGNFKGQTLDGKGGVRYGDAGIFFDALQLYSEHSKITLEGNPTARAGVKFTVEIQGPDWVSSYLGGEASGQGHIALGADQPVIDVVLEATQLQWGDTQIERISIGPADASQTAGINLAMDISNLQSGQNTLQTARFVLTGDRDQQALTLDIKQQNYRLNTALLGALSGWASLDTLSWAGVLEDTQLSLNGDELFVQSAPGPVSFSMQQIQLAQTCLVALDSGRLCVSSDWQPGENLDIAVNLSALPLSISTLVLDHGIDFTQTLDGEFKWQQARGRSPNGRLAVTISAGEFGDVQERFERVKTGKGFLGFELDDGNLTAGELNIPFPGVGLVDLDYTVSGLMLNGTGQVDGELQIDLNDISVLEGLIPGLENFGGRLNSDLILSGLTSEPHLDGHVELLDASADIPLVGTQLREVSLKGKVSNTGTAVLEGEFKAGEGLGRIKLTSSFANWGAPELKLSINGQGLRVLNTPELRMDADADMSLAWADQQWTIGGSVLVQDAKITPVAVVLGKVTESEDVEIVQGELAYSGHNENQQPARLDGNLQIGLGDKVRVETDQVKTNLSGTVDLTWQGSLIPVADGSIQASGTVSVFGPRLTLQDGQIRFPNIPVNNPILSIRAERDIFGNTQIRTAGVSISGTVKRPVIDAYTVPLTNSDRAWALLITGNDVDYGRSVGAFEVGTYIAPRLYLSYGISLFDDDNVVSARYDLKKGFGIKASSGQREAGVDMSYTIDR